MLGDLGIDEFAAVRLERASVPSSSAPISRRVAGDIGRKDRSQPAFDTFLGHKDCPKPPDSSRVYGYGVGCVYEETMSASGSAAVASTSHQVRYTLVSRH